MLDLSGIAATLPCCETSHVMLQQLALMCSNDGMKAQGAGRGPDIVGASQCDVCRRDVQFAIGMM